MKNVIFVLYKVVYDCGEYYYSDIVGAYETKELLAKAVANDISKHCTYIEGPSNDEYNMNWEYYDCGRFRSYNIYYKGKEVQLGQIQEE